MKRFVKQQVEVEHNNNPGQVMLNYVSEQIVAAAASSAVDSSSSSSMTTRMMNHFVGDYNNNNFDYNLDDDTSSSSYEPLLFHALTLPIDNASHRDWLSFCPNLERAICNADNINQPVMDRILRWLKLIVLKLARSYYALPVLLVVVPLTLGVLIGFFLGRLYEKKATQKRLKTFVVGSNSSTNDNGQRNHMGQSSFQVTTTTTYLGILRSWMWSCLFWSARFFPQKSYTSTPDDPLNTAAAKDQRSNSAGGKETKNNQNEHVRITPSLIQPAPKKQLELSPDTITFFPQESDHPDLLEQKEQAAREELTRESSRESNVSVEHLPRHIAIIMDGNRRYGRSKHGNATSGHWDGSRKLLEMAKWCIAEQIQVLTVFAFSTENWNRDPSEVAALMTIFVKYCEEIRHEALKRNIRVHVWSTDVDPIPEPVKVGLRRLEQETQHCHVGLQMNICLSYGSRHEILRACRSVAQECLVGSIKSPEHITEESIRNALLSRHCMDPDILIRTSGELRMSNFLLWQTAYTELFFTEKLWPDLQKEDLLEVIQSYANRGRRFGK